ncbi:MAG: hypothetical protein HC881_10720 [Leptolyngbyaceae cyanobacterium SL_7_1]|nr:hypothetical protein [Leptolyngbyaceae cyanobacterium SL_7_1]
MAQLRLLTDSLTSTEMTGTSHASSRSSSFVIDEGAGSSTAIVTSSSGETSFSNETIATPEGVQATSTNHSISNHSTTEDANGSSHSSSSSSSFVNDSGAGSSSTAIATSPSGETSYSSETTFVPGATSSSGTAIAVTTPTGTDTAVVVEAPASAPPVLPPSPTGLTGKVLLGTSTRNRIRGTRRNDTIRGKDGNDKLVGNDGGDRCFGGAGDDTLLGGGGNDWLNGGTGDDLLMGGPGGDALVGGRGADTFVLTDRVTDPAQADVIRDFRARQGDTLKLKIADVTLAEIVLKGFDLNGDGRNDSTLIQISTDNSTVAIALGTVNAAGQTTLTLSNFA